MLSFKQIRAFIIVADLKSFTQAAEELFMTQPAVSAQIKTMEEHLGVPLIVRNDKRVRLTDAGQIFYREARELMTIYNRAIESMDEIKALKKGSLSLGASTIPGEYIMPHFIGEFRRLFPGINITLNITDTGQVVDLLYDRKIDLGVVGAKVESSYVEYFPFLQDELVLIAGMGYPIEEEISIGDLSSLEWISREAGSGTRSVVRDCLAAQGIKESDLKIVMELGSTQAVVTGVISNLGVGFVSHWAADVFIKAGVVQQVKIRDLDLKRHIYAVISKNTAATRARDVFLDHLLRQKKEEQEKKDPQ
ncbi:MAG: selenium metabolism-associated LysR family transcriptional regulator [Dehalobacterium sp.]|jgi:DNA-binding transcriptional LysR family regulator